MSKDNFETLQGKIQGGLQGKSCVLSASRLNLGDARLTQSEEYAS